ncbi:hypothetical protein BRC82_08195 [Halobacteriales archaeon QS_1_67_19]|nr:MAG: hypothetical protein BRC82_08195 [Halobacteriales archaeon QS_1_67_19]
MCSRICSTEDTKHKLISNRRKVLKTLGTAGVAATVGIGSFAGTAMAIDDDPNNNWPHTMEIALASDQKAYHSSTVSWYGSEYLDSRSTWIHDVSLGTVGSSQWDSGARIEDIVGNYYEMFPKDYNEDGLVDADTNSDRQGIYPDGRGEDLPEWVEITTDLAIGALNAPAGFVVAADDMAAALQPKDGLKSIKNDKGFEFLNTPGYFEDNWSDISHFQRALYESEANAQADDDLVVHGRCGRGGGDFTTNVQFLMSFWKDDVNYVSEDESRGDCTNSTSCTSSSSSTNTLSTSDSGGTTSGSDDPLPFSESMPQERKKSMVVSTTNPHEMTKGERKALGIERVDPSNPPMGVQERDGELPSFVATNIPMTIYARQMARNDSGKKVDVVQQVGQ